MEVVCDQIRTFAAADLSALITGEMGVGKERAARAIHARSRRRSAPFVRHREKDLPPAR